MPRTPYWISRKSSPDFSFLGAFFRFLHALQTRTTVRHEGSEKLGSCRDSASCVSTKEIPGLGGLLSTRCRCSLRQHL